MSILYGQQDQLRGNETYRQISHLEEQLTDLIKDNQTMDNALTQMKLEFDYGELKRQAEGQLNEIMELLRADNAAAVAGNSIGF